MSRLALALAMLLASGCTKTSEKYCAQNPNAVECVGGDDAGPRCTTSAECTAPLGVCDRGAMTCVECTDTEAAACTGTTPLCGADNRCESCQEHTDCESGACLPDGSCGTAENVAFVEGGASGGNEDCTTSEPCDSFQKAFALAPRRPYVLVRGTISENVAIDDRDVTILASPSARLRAGTGTTLLIDGTSNVEVHDLIIGDAGTDTGTRGVNVLSGATGTILFRGVTITRHITGGFLGNGGKITIEQSRIAENRGGGIRLGDQVSAYAIRNNFIYFNGISSPGTPTATGGMVVELQGISGKIELNTIVANHSGGDPHAAGLACYGASSQVTGNIIAGNVGVQGGQTSLSCSESSNFINPSLTSIGFVNTTPMGTNFHLTSASPPAIKDALQTCGTLPAIDIDGDARPAGDACDIGADEYVP